MFKVSPVKKNVTQQQQLVVCVINSITLAFYFRNIKKMVLDLFDENPRQYSSAEKAADYYLEVLEKQNITRSHRTVADWIRERAREKGIRFR